VPKGYPRTIETALRKGPAPPPAEPVITFDDVEDEEWFQRLPDAAKDDMRRAWAEDEARGVRREHLAKSTRTRSMVQATLVLLFTETCCAIPSWGHTAAAIPAGLALGAVWHRIGAGRFRCMTTSIVPFVVLRVAFVGDRQGFSLAAYCIYSLLGFLMLLALSAGVGFVRERRRADDMDY
jgi:hypothetical protein